MSNDYQYGNDYLILKYKKRMKLIRPINSKQTAGGTNSLWQTPVANSSKPTRICSYYNASTYYIHANVQKHTQINMNTSKLRH